MVNIPIADKHEETAVNQHLVPRCYMREWSYNQKQTSVWMYDKTSDFTDVNLDKINILCNSKRLKKINAIDNYYDIKAGYYSMPQEALDEIFGPTMHLIVTLDGELLDSKKKRNDKFGLFDEWIITDNDNKQLSEEDRNKLKNYFSEARFVFIEKEWDKQYENNWRTYIKDFERKICEIKVNQTIKGIISSDMLSEIMKLVIIFDIRGFFSNEFLNEQINKIFDILPSEFSTLELKPEDRMHPSENTCKESFVHQFILHVCYDILKGNKMTGIAKLLWDFYVDNLILYFRLTDSLHPFVTSEHPVFINTYDNGNKECFFVALPTMLISLGRGEKGQFMISSLTKQEVAKYNKIIIQNNDIIISSTNKIDI